VQVDQWLPDDPYPKAMLRDLDGSPVTEEHRELMTEAERLVRKSLAYKAELSERTAVPATFELAEDADIAAWQLAAYAPLGQVDQLRLLGEDDPAGRLRLLVEFAADAVAMLEFRLASG
jgi:hypothetical protein